MPGPINCFRAKRGGSSEGVGDPGSVSPVSSAHGMWSAAVRNKLGVTSIAVAMVFMLFWGLFVSSGSASFATDTSPRSLPEGESLYVFDQDGAGLFEVTATGESTRLFATIEIFDLEGDPVDPLIENGFFNFSDNRIYFVETNTFLLASFNVLTGQVETIADVRGSLDLIDPWGMAELDTDDGKLIRFLAFEKAPNPSDDQFFIWELDLDTGELTNPVAIPDNPEPYGLAVSKFNGLAYVMSEDDTIELVDESVTPTQFVQKADLETGFSDELQDFLWDGSSDSDGVIWFQSADYSDGGTVDSFLFSFDPRDDGVVLQGQISGGDDGFGTGITLSGRSTEAVALIEGNGSNPGGSGGETGSNSSPAATTGEAVVAEVAPPEPSLAATGTDSLNYWLGVVLGALLLALGVATQALSRRRSSQT